MKEKIKEILYKYTETLTLKGIIDDTDEWLWEGEFDKVADEIIAFFASNNHYPAQEKQ